MNCWINGRDSRKSFLVFESQVQAPKVTSYDNLECQGFGFYCNPPKTWNSTLAGPLLHKDMWSDPKNVFDMQPTNRELDIIQLTGKCEVWIRGVSCSSIAQITLKRTVRHKSIKPCQWHDATITQVSGAKWACNSTSNVKCVGMLRTELFQNLPRLPTSMRFRLSQPGYASTLNLNSELVFFLIKCISKELPTNQ